MTTRLESEVRCDIAAILARADIGWEPCGRGSILVSKFLEAATRTPETFRQANIPFEEMRGGYLVCAYDIGQLARQGWRPPQMA
ncbi:MAG: hypothetical protein HYS17_06005 [Micavibrio aeruginosavorus]|uniref:Uncharacterized protein n=1 Tax=Micavibrio aeruginosavorus TaxID=349221 RepID=A0A7T5R4C7_9BACT|nr:MAG: hypothetical protein HYS17_06005 [Micavibrio aeruginosavorus]